MAACVLFFQAVLLAGYLYAHWVRSAWIHIALLAVSLLFLPAAPRAEVWKDVWKPLAAGDPSLRILLPLAATVGAPYFLLSSTAPLLQRWFSLSEPGKLLWRLYALSNFGSFLALLSYPWRFSPSYGCERRAGFGRGFMRRSPYCAGWTAWQAPSMPVMAVAPASDRGSDHSGESRPGVWKILFWLGLSASGSTLLLATTNQISQEIAVNPFLWIAPLSLYLLSFVLTFESVRWYRRGPFAVMAGLGAAAVCVVASAAVAVSLWAQLAVYLAGLFAACMVCHGELVRSRPSPRYLTEIDVTVAPAAARWAVFSWPSSPRTSSPSSANTRSDSPAACLLGLAGWLGDGGLKLWSSRNLALRIPIMALSAGRCNFDCRRRDRRRSAECGKPAQFLRHSTRVATGRRDLPHSRAHAWPHHSRLPDIWSNHGGRGPPVTMGRTAVSRLP